MTPDVFECPACGAPPGCLSVTFRLACAPLGSLFPRPESCPEEPDDEPPGAGAPTSP